MSYRMSKLSFGTSILTSVFDIQTDFLITGLCHIDEFGFLFLFRDHHCIGYSDYKGQFIMPWMGNIDQKGNTDGTLPLFNYPSSICYWPSLKACYLFDSGGFKLKSIEINSKYCSNISLHGAFDKYFSRAANTDLIETSCDINSHGDLYWVVKDLHRCFKKKMEDNIVHNYVGNGRSGFSVSNNLGLCSFSYPSGLKCINDSIYISDEGNHCVREINNNVVKIVVGHPLNDKILFSPSQIVYGNGIIYVLDKGNIKYLSLKDQNNGLIYSSPNIVAIEINKKDLYVLERV